MDNLRHISPLRYLPKSALRDATVSGNSQLQKNVSAVQLRQKKAQDSASSRVETIMSLQTEIAEDPSPDFFKHEPLPDPATYIRLLEILEGQMGQHVICEVSTWQVDDAPPYYAISYTWGDPASTTNVTVNGKPMTVRRNCEYVLQQAFASRASKYFWVDAICIDQESTHEKNHQVAMMGQIYNKATHVFSCVGTHDDDTQFLAGFIEKREKLIQEVLPTLRTEGMHPSALDSIMDYSILREKKLALRLLLRTKSGTRKRLLPAFLSLLKRPYFTRVWILQELYQAVNVSFCCGKDIHPLRYLLAVGALSGFRNCNRWHYAHQARKFRQIHTQMFELAGSRVFDEVMSRLYCLAIACGCGRLQPLSDIMSIIQDFDCVDARDRIYGIISLVDWEAGLGAPPQPDYEKDRFELAKQVIDMIWPARDWNGYIMEAYRVLTIFDISTDMGSMRRAIRSRRRPVRSTAKPKIGFSRLLSYDWEWYGVEICAQNERIHKGRSLSEDHTMPERFHLQNWEPGREQPFTKLCDDQGLDMAYVPWSTKPGDWILEHAPARDVTGSMDWLLELLPDRDMSQGWEHSYLVIRPDTSGRYYIIGTGFGVRRFRLPRKDRNFFISWYPEDLLILAWRCIPGVLDGSALSVTTDSSEPEDEIFDFLEFRVCAFFGSSYATRNYANDAPDSETANSLDSDSAPGPSDATRNGERNKGFFSHSIEGIIRALSRKQRA